MIHNEDDSTLNVLMYLFHHHMYQDNETHVDDMQLVDELKLAGFHAHNIGKAFRWLYHLDALSKQETAPSAQSFRIFSEEECLLINEECRNFIFSLEQQGILTPRTREIVIHQALELIHEGIDLSLLKWVTLMVLFNIPHSENALSHMESLVLINAFETQH